jgi:hypothetical protein
MVEAENLDGRARSGFFDLFAAIVVERAYPAPGVAGDDRVADPERAALDEHRGHRAAADVEPRLDDRAGGLRLRVRLQLELGVRDEEHLLEQLVEVLLGLCGDVRELNLAAPILRLEPFGGEVARTRFGSRPGGRSCWSRDDDRDLGCRACEIDSRVWGMTPSSAATTSTAMSVTLAPRARMAVKAS